MIFKRFTQFLTRLNTSHVAFEKELIGCSEAEIAALESKYQCQLPRSYRDYLAAMGHQSGRLFTFDHLAVFYSYVLTMTDEVFNEIDVPNNFNFPKNALLISGRLGTQFEFIICNAKNDSPVYYFNTWDWTIKQSQPSIYSWLEAWCDEAERAIANGYFIDNPLGTTP